MTFATIIIWSSLTLFNSLWYLAVAMALSRIPDNKWGQMLGVTFGTSCLQFWFTVTVVRGLGCPGG